MRRGLALGLCLLFVGCTDDGEVPNRVDSGFVFLTDAFPFENFADNARGQGLTSDLVGRMFGPELVCKNGGFPCVLTEVGTTWAASVNQTLEAGRSEGFSVLALLFFKGQLDPNDFGATTVARLSLDGNAKLQAELAYWAATQAVPGALDDDVRFAAKDVMPFLATALAPGNPEAYRLAIAIKDDNGFERGHALVPIGYYRGDRDGLYHLRVYDNNFARQERLLDIDTVANRWEYTVPVGDGALTYEGTTENGNLLYFSPVMQRTGELPCPFAADSGVTTLATSGGLQVMAGSAGTMTGIVAGAVVEADNAKVVPAFSNCPLCNPGKRILNYTIPSNATDAVNVVVSGGIGLGSTDGTASVNVTGPNYTTTVSGIRGNAVDQDQINVTPSGDVTYTATSGSDIDISSSSSDASGTETTIRVTLDGVGSDASVQLRRVDGKAQVETTGIPEGQTVTVTITTKDSTGASVDQEITFVSGGTDTRVDVNPTTGAVTMETGVTGVAGGPCFNNMLDAAFETDVDCGGEMCTARCSVSEACGATSDCSSGLLCVARNGVSRCEMQGCDDGARNGTETDIDCGGSCRACVATNDALTTPLCSSVNDCDSGLCESGRCRKKNPVRLRVNGMATGELVRVTSVFDGASMLAANLTAGTELGPKVFTLGEAFAYTVTLVEGPAGQSCTVRAGTGSGTTGFSGTGDTQADGEVIIDCTRTGTELRVLFDNQADPQAADYTVGLTVTRDGSPVVATLSSALGPVFPLGLYTTNYNVAITTQPGVIGNRFGFDTTYGAQCEISGLGAPASGSGLAGAAVTVRLLCTAPSCTAEPSRCGMSMDGGTGTMDAGTDAGTDAGFDAGFDAGAGGCTSDSDCPQSDCVCGAQSGNCSGGSGSCGAGKAIFDQPTSDGVAPSGTFTVPAGCSQVLIQAWGAAGGAGGMNGGFFFNAGGAGGFVGGVLPVTAGDVFTVWVGQGGSLNTTTGPGGTPAIGSNVGTAANGGAGDGSPMVVEAGGAGGGLTSVRRTGSATTTFVVPAGGGAGGFLPGGDVADGSGGSEAGPAGASAGPGSNGGGGGAGATGGAAGNPSEGGAYGPLPAGLASSDGPGAGVAPNNASSDWGARCLGLDGDANAGTGSDFMDHGGSGCVSIRCQP